ncbi:hypothetical protein KGF56_001585 [Candida oxycetoniae]|uniref:Uncharacterized protein n=1 Tax=Candida oxycetoniae TaxID=497107 RepID=A0AAI9SZD1_9ASCO|nr:uncharacterized protein KGF56_001585 [Candida oxycetoniae]KAI3405567.2 hypothetical protein KGF56_001585 [Candida oxycetoniae]
MVMYPSLSSQQFREALKDISQFELEFKKKQQLTFIFKLIDTNNELHQELLKSESGHNSSGTVELSPEDAKLYKETIDENKVALLEQIERVQSINDELVQRGFLSPSQKGKEEKKLMEDIKEKEKGVEVDKDQGVVL